MFMRNARAILALMMVLGCAACTTRGGSVEPASVRGESLRIGMIADTQVTTAEATSGYLFRTIRADALQNVAVRTTAQEKLSVEHLGYMLTDLARRAPDVILYLGDGANSGCQDEIDAFFGALEAARERTGVPVFFSVGNHDYLATGNQASPDQRRLACGGKPYLDKAKLVAKTAEFNRASWERHARKAGVMTSYVDSLAAVTSRNGRGCNAAEATQHVDGCFYAAVLGFRKGARAGHLVLVDTSDYRDLKVNPSIRGGYSWMEGRGLRGGVSYMSGGQNAWILEALDRSGNDDRFFASHYPTRDLNWGKFRSGRLGDLLFPAGRNVWLSAHTHEKDPAAPARRDIYYKVPGSKEPRSALFDEINIGSTTDYRSHGAIVEVVDGRASKFPVPALGDEQRATCKSWLEGLSLDAGYGYPMAGKNDIAMRLGLTADYRKPGYNDKVARANLDHLLRTAENEAQHEQWIRCLMDTAAEAESKARKWDWWTLIRPSPPVPAAKDGRGSGAAPRPSEDAGSG